MQYMKKPLITGIGEIVWDILPSGARLGGAPLNFAYMAGRLGCEGRIISAVGDDELGKKTLCEISSLGMAVDNIQVNGFPTGQVLVSLDGNGIPQYDIREGSSWDNISLREEDLGLMASSDAVCWGILSQRSDVSAASITALLDATPKECLKIFDINIRQHFYTKESITASLERCDILKLNEDELPLVAEMFCEGRKNPIAWLSKTFGIHTIVLTKGADCSEIYRNGECVSHIDTPKVKVADTIGAGDSFTACFVARLLVGVSTRKAHEDAVKLSAYICTCNGAINEPVF